jgi:cell division septation protein DedD
MQRGLGGSVFEPVQEPEMENLRAARDREWTLGPAMLMTLGVVLFALCAACFVFGYAVGRGSTTEVATVAASPTSGTPAFAQPAASASKPSAAQSGAQPQAPAAAAGRPDASASDSTPVPAPATVAVSTDSNGGAASAGPGEPVIHAALPGQTARAEAAADTRSGVQPALTQASGIMVQIAAVSHPEDADVLVSALRKRGYAVSSRRDPTDGLLHVQVGPFANRDDATAMRQKLLNDGYNAIVQP